MNKKVSVIIILSIILSLSGIILINNNNNKKEMPIYRSSAMWLYDTSTPEEAIGISQYAFVAKVNKVLRTEYKNPIEVEISADGKETKTIYSPYTIYEITIIDNIKGSLVTNKPIEFMHYGGINKDEDSYTFLDNGKMLVPGNYYILLPSVWNDENILEVSEPSRIIELGKNLKSSTSVNSINLYKKAYINQIIPEDFKSNPNISKYDVNYTQ